MEHLEKATVRANKKGRPPKKQKNGKKNKLWFFKVACALVKTWYIAIYGHPSHNGNLYHG